MALTACKGPAGERTAPSRDAYPVARAAPAPQIDGVGDEPAWRAAMWSPDFAPTEGGAAMGQRTRAKLLYDDRYLYALVVVDDGDVFSPYTGRDDSLWKADVVEMFIDADRSGAGYIELQVNPNNAQFDAWFERTRHDGIDIEWSSGLRSAVSVRGTVAERSDRDEGWSVELAVPLEAVKGRDDGMPVAVPPAPGDSWRLNLVRIDLAPGAPQITATSWNPIPIRDFHALDRMLTVTFAPPAQ